jgi:hypothetical protein
MNRSAPRVLFLAAVATLLAFPAPGVTGIGEDAGISARPDARAPRAAAETPEQRERALFQDSDVSLRIGCNSGTPRGGKKESASAAPRFCR